MVVDTGIINLGGFLSTHKELTDFCLNIQRLEEILKNDEIRYLYLASLISADSMIDIKSTKDCLNKIIFLKENVKYMNIDDKIKKEVIKYTNKGIKIAKRDLKKFEFELLKDYR